MTRPFIRHPQPRTLAKYGLREEDYQAILRRQRWGCGVCHEVPPSGILHIDHEHVRGFKNMNPEEKRKYVRGLACWSDNAVWLRRGATPARLRAAAAYLARYERTK